MSRDRVNKHVYCKLAVFMNAEDKPLLQSKLSEALAKLKKVGERKEASGENSRYIRAVIYHREYAGMLFGILASYERGTSQLTVVDDDDVEMLTLDQVAPPKSKDNKRQEFLEGVCYFGVYKNHFVIVTSRPLGTKPTEQHINWLLETADVLGKEANRVGLSDHISQVTKQKIESAHVKQVEIGTPLIDPQSTQEVKSADGKRVVSFEYGGLGVDILSKVFGNNFGKIRLADAIDGNIEITLKVRYKKKTTEKAHKVLDDIALQLRHIDEDDVKVNLVGGATIKGRELKLSSPLSVEARDGVPNQDEMFRKMRDWLMSQIENQIIEP